MRIKSAENPEIAPGRVGRVRLGAPGRVALQTTGSGVRRIRVRPPAISLRDGDSTDVPTETNGGAPRLLVSLATYNERDNLRDLVGEIRQVAPHASIL